MALMTPIISPSSVKPATPASMQRHVQFGLALIAALFILFLPVLLFPHWGLFDDPSLILQSGRRLMDDPSTISYVLAAQMRMGIFYWVTVLWRIFPENPAGFFATNFVLLASAMVLLYSICFKLTNSTRLSLFSSAAVLASPSLFEVIYTLDKQEAYFPFLFTAVIFAHILATICKPRALPLLGLGSALCSTACYLSKETGVILCLFSGLFLVANLIARSNMRRENLLRCGVLFLSTLAPLLALKLCIFPTLSEHYVTMTFDVQKLLLKTYEYATVIPDFFLVLAFSSAGGIWLALSRAHNKGSWQWCAFVSLLLSSLIATAALISFDTFAVVLLYIWLPIYFFLVPSLAYVLNELSGSAVGARVNKVFIAAFILLLLTQLPTRVLQAQFQFSLDALTKDLAVKVSSLVAQSKEPLLGTMPAYTIDETEIPEQIETHVRSLLQRRYYETKNEKTSDHSFAMLNYLSPDCENNHLATDPANVFRLAEFRGRALTYTNECPAGYVGWTGFQILNGATPFQSWVKRPFGKGNLLLVPYGDVVPDTILYRGAVIFAYPWNVRLLNFPQLTFEEVGHVERKLTKVFGHRQTIGWKILKVVTAEPLSMNTSTDGWLPSGGKIFYRHSPEQAVLRITSGQPVSPSLVMTGPNGADVVVGSLKEGDHAVVDLPLRSLPAAGSLSLKDRIGNARLHIDGIKFMSKSGTETTHVTQDSDGWLRDKAMVVYVQADSGRNLVIETKQHCEHVLTKGMSAVRDLNIANGFARIPLIDGKPTGDGRFYLELFSPQSIAPTKENRQLLIHCDRYFVQ